MSLASDESLADSTLLSRRRRTDASLRHSFGTKSFRLLRSLYRSQRRNGPRWSRLFLPRLTKLILISLQNRRSGRRLYEVVFHVWSRRRIAPLRRGGWEGRTRQSGRRDSTSSQKVSSISRRLRPADVCATQSCSRCIDVESSSARHEENRRRQSRKRQSSFESTRKSSSGTEQDWNEEHRDD